MGIDKDKFKKKLESKMSTDLPPLPTTITEIIRLTANPYAVSAGDIAKVVERDQAMTAKLLRIANSAYYGFSQRIKTISHAIVCLGINQIKSLVYTLDINKTMGGALKAYGLGNGILYKHSLAVALCARAIAQKIKMVDSEEVYIMGLLHDIGKMVLDQHGGDEFTAVLDMYKQGGRKFYQCEKSILGLNHAEVGADVALRWNFPPELAKVIEHHHTPHRFDQPKTYVVFIADGVAKTLPQKEENFISSQVLTELGGVFDKGNLAKIGLHKDSIFEIRESVLQEVNQYSAELNQ